MKQLWKCLSESCLFETDVEPKKINESDKDTHSCPRCGCEMVKASEHSRPAMGKGFLCE